MPYVEVAPDVSSKLGNAQTNSLLSRNLVARRICGAVVHIKEFSMKTLLIAILTLFTMALTSPLQAAPEPEKSLYERLGAYSLSLW